jgi:hypothetical protein
MNAPSMWLKVQPLVDKHCSHVAKKTKRFLRGTNERWGFNHQLAIDMAMSQPGCHWQSKSPLETAHGMVSPSCFSFSTSCNNRIPHDVTGSYLVGGLKMFETFFVFPYIGNNNPKWLIFFRGVGQPPTSDWCQWYGDCHSEHLGTPNFPGSLAAAGRWK